MRDDLLQQFVTNQNSQIEKHARLRESEAFAAQAKRLQRLTEGFATAVHATWLMSRRAPNIYDDFLSFRFVDDLLQSAVAIWSLAKEGQLNAAKREMRYMLEASTKHAYVDIKLMGKALPDKTKYLSDVIPSSSLKFINDFRLYTFTCAENKEFMNLILSSYGLLSRYVHRSPEQIEEALRLMSLGVAPAFETAQQVESFVRDLSRMYDVVLVLLFNALGVGLAGDVFVNVLDCMKDWPFHKTRFVKKLSLTFDYKSERNAL